MTLLQFSSFLKCAPKGMCARSSLTISSLSRPGKTRVLSSTQQVYSSDKVQRTECELAEPETPPRLIASPSSKNFPEDEILCLAMKLFWVVGRPGPQFSTSKLPSEITSCSEAFRPTWSSSESTEYLQDSNSRVCEKKPC